MPSLYEQHQREREGESHRSGTEEHEHEGAVLLQDRPAVAAAPSTRQRTGRSSPSRSPLQTMRRCVASRSCLPTFPRRWRSCQPCRCRSRRRKRPRPPRSASGRIARSSETGAEAPSTMATVTGARADGTHAIFADRVRHLTLPLRRDRGWCLTAKTFQWGSRLPFLIARSAVPTVALPTGLTKVLLPRTDGHACLTRTWRTAVRQSRQVKGDAGDRDSGVGAQRAAQVQADVPVQWPLPAVFDDDLGHDHGQGHLGSLVVQRFDVVG
jgi:hypothetical protein